MTGALSPASPSPPSPSPARVRMLTAAGLVLYTAGALLSGSDLRIPAEFVRVLALAVLAIAPLRRRSLMPWIFWAMLAGVELGIDAPAAAVSLRVLSDIFLRLIKTIVAPLVLGTLITGIAAHGEMRSVGRLGWKTLVYFELLTTLALLIGLAAINLTHAGVGLVVAPPDSGALPAAAAPLRWNDVLVHSFPENLARAVAENQILQVAVFAVLFGLALGRLTEQRRAPMLRLAESLTETMFAFTNIVMYMAPLGVGAAMAYTVGTTGPAVLVHLGKLVLTLYLAIVAFVLLVLWPVALLARVPLRRFLRAVAEPASIAFATSTSEAALPRAFEAMEALGVPRRIVGFVIPAGYSFNLAGSALYLSLASVFVAQAAGIRLGWSGQLMMAGTLMLTSKGVAGVPRASLVVLLATAAIFHLPEEPIFVLLGVDALLDMGRTTINVVGNCLTCVLVAQWESEFAPASPRTEAPSPEAAAMLRGQGRDRDEAGAEAE